MAAAKYDDEELKTFGLKRLVLKFLHVEMEKSKRITLSKWDVNKLSKQQIRCCNRYICFFQVSY